MLQIVKILCLIFFCSCITYFAHGQDGCYECSRDSLIKQLGIENEPVKKITLLKFMIDFAPTSDSANSFIEQLIDLNARAKTLNDEPYKQLREGNVLYGKKEFGKALQAYKKTVLLFDKQRKRIPNLLLGFRNLFNLLNIQEERYVYYKERLDYYLLTGPFENTAAAFHGIGGFYAYKADYNQAISYYLRAAEVFKRFYPYWYFNANGIVGIYYAEWGNLKKGLAYLNYALPNLKRLHAQNPFTEITSGYYAVALSQIKLKQKEFDDARVQVEELIKLNEADTSNRFYALGLYLKALVKIRTNQVDSALPLLIRAKNIIETFHNGRMTTFNSTLEIDFGLYEYFTYINDSKSAENAIVMAYKKSLEEKSTVLQIKYLKELTMFYSAQNVLDSSKKYLSIFFQLQDTIETQQSNFKIAQYEHDKKQIEQLQNITLLKQERAIQQASISKRNTILIISLIALLLLSASMLFLYRQLQINKKTVQSLKSTQSQLIHAEKMASLGELTAGIAHEIQNPLNFVNNFSEVNIELIEELKSEKLKLKSDRDEQVEESLLNDIVSNLEKITHHGKRADAIVKGMLQHSRIGSAQMEPANINALADEYLRLAYHGLRAKDKSLNAILKTDYDEAIGNINIIPQDIGRVILNLITNAFYAASQNASSEGMGAKHIPTVWVSTKKLGKKVEIKVRDNGPGIPQKILDKIFQPFFTTKPAGKGTGLGLSLSYDIVKAHMGELQVKTKEGEGTEFTIELPA